MTKYFTKDFGLQLLLIGLFIFGLYSNVQLVIRNHALGQILTAKKELANKQKYDNDRLKLLIGYYQSASYQEVEARRRLQLKKPDETVYIVKGLSTPADTNQALTINDNVLPEVKVAPPVTKPNIQLWWEYFTR